MFCLVFLLVSCKSDKKDSIETTEKELSVAEEIANANGFDHWKKVSEIQFTFNVDRDSSHFERSWTWKPKVDEVTLICKIKKTNKECTSLFFCLFCLIQFPTLSCPL